MKEKKKSQQIFLYNAGVLIHIKKIIIQLAKIILTLQTAQNIPARNTFRYIKSHVWTTNFVAETA